MLDFGYSWLGVLFREYRRWEDGIGEAAREDWAFTARVCSYVSYLCIKRWFRLKELLQ